MTSYQEFKHLLMKKQYREALLYAESAVERSGDTVFWLNQQAIALSRLGRFKEAVSAADRALARSPSNEFSLVIRAESLLKEGKCNDALTCFEEAAYYPRVEIKARKGILDCLLQLGHFQKVLDEIGRWTNDTSEWYSWQIGAYAGLDRIDEAIKMCHTWLKQSTDNRKALWLLCDLEVKRDGIEPTLIKYEKIAKIPSSSPIYGEICAMLNRKAGKVDRAISQYDRIAGLLNDPSIIRRKAFALAKSGHERDALPLFEELLRSSPNDRYVHNAYSAAARRIGYLENAWAFYHELLGIHPDEKTLYGRIKKIGKELELMTSSKEITTTES